MRVRLIIANISAVLLGLYGYYAAATIFAVKCECGGADYVLAPGLFLPACAFLVPSAHARLVSLTYGWLGRLVFLSLAILWLFIGYLTLFQFHQTAVPLPFWGFVSEQFIAIWFGMNTFLILAYLLPGLAYDIVRDNKAADATPEDSEIYHSSTILADAPSKGCG